MQTVEVSESKSKYETAVGHKTGSGQICEVLARHGWRKVMPRSRHPKKAGKKVMETSKKINLRVKELKEEAEKSWKTEGKVRLMFQDEAGFVRINKPKYCRRGVRPFVPCHHVWEYRYAYGAVSPKSFLRIRFCSVATGLPGINRKIW